MNEDFLMLVVPAVFFGAALLAALHVALKPDDPHHRGFVQLDFGSRQLVVHRWTTFFILIWIGTLVALAWVNAMAGALVPWMLLPAGALFFSLTAMLALLDWLSEKRRPDGWAAREAQLTQKRRDRRETGPGFVVTVVMPQPTLAITLLVGLAGTAALDDRPLVALAAGLGALLAARLWR